MAEITIKDITLLNTPYINIPSNITDCKENDTAIHNERPYCTTLVAPYNNRRSKIILITTQMTPQMDTTWHMTDISIHVIKHFN